MKKDWKTLTLVGVIALLTLVLLGNLPAMARQGHMEKALSALEQAKSELEQASHNKGGHRVKAIKLINEAISEVEKGIRYAETHNPRHRGSRAHHVNLDDLVGMKARNLDSTMESRGFINKGGYKQHHISYTTWWNAFTEQCVSVGTKEGHVKKVEAIFEGNCK